MKYPAWFPYPKSWLRAIMLCLYLVPIKLVYERFGETIAYQAIQPNTTPNDFLGLIGAVLIGTVLTPIITISYAHHFLIGKSPDWWAKWLPSPKSLWEGFYSLLVLLFWIFLLGGILTIRFTVTKDIPSDTAISLLSFTFFAYAYQIDALILLGITQK